jgi:prepilin-type N-terminal cleavage/methylation domain-containing protein
MTLNRYRSSAGFTLVEALVAIALIATAAAALAQLVALGTRQSANNRDALMALVAAQSKLEALRSMTWSYTVASTNLTPSPVGSLFNDTPGHVDYPAPFARRWAVTRRDPADTDVVVIDVCVFAPGRRGAAPEACVSTIRTRRP